VLAVGKADPTILGLNAVSLALHTSHIPWAGPIGAVHIGIEKGGSELVVNHFLPQIHAEPTYDLDMIICGRQEKITMIEALSYEHDEVMVGNAFDRALSEIKTWEMFNESMRDKQGKEKIIFEFLSLPDALENYLQSEIKNQLYAGLFGEGSKKHIYTIEDIWMKYVKEFLTNHAEKEKLIGIAKDAYHNLVDQLVHQGGLQEGKRVDLRKSDEVRALYAQTGGISPVLHGSGIFYRGETHVASFLTLGGPDDVNVIEGMEVRGNKRFMHHYNFPPYSVGEAGRFGGINRREMGHGFLAEKALWPVIPEKTVFPYTIRVVSECMASNGSTSQASICASTLALMDGGVPIVRPVAGIAMGLLQDETNPSTYMILTDIQGPEDHFGDMDFKVAGTSKGITALQLDIKTWGIAPQILKEALVQARIAHKHILETMSQEIAQPRADISPRAPKIAVTKINPEKIGMVIGSGGKTVNEIREKTGAEIVIEDDGTVFATGKDGAADRAIEIINTMTKEWKVGETLTVPIIKIIEVGALVKLSEFADGLVHISEIAPFRIEKVTDVLKEGMEVPVKIISVDPEKHRIGLSIKQADPDFIKNPYEKKTE
jgi:polyribonucleotide nucleotidyltransferase